MQRPRATDPEVRLGPYFGFSRWVDGRVVHRVIPDVLAPRVRQAQENHRRIRALLADDGEATAKKAPAKRAAAVADE